MPKPLLPVTERALIQRINRKLAAEGQQLKTARSEGVERTVGRHHIIDIKRSCIAQQRVDIEALARKLDVLKPFEKLV